MRSLILHFAYARLWLSSFNLKVASSKTMDHEPRLTTEKVLLGVYEVWTAHQTLTLQFIVLLKGASNSRMPSLI